jgi:thioredoxin reductase (NADPH)
MAERAEPLGAGVAEPENVGGAFPRLTDAQLAKVRAAGAVRPMAAGEVLFREGDLAYDFFVVEAGSVTIVQGYGAENRVIAVHGSRRFLGELNLLTGAPPLLSAIVREPGSVIQVPVAELTRLVAANEDLSNLILRALLARRAIMIDRGAGIRVIGSRFSRDTQRLREFLRRNRMPYQWLELEQDEEAAALLDALSIAPDETPVVLAAGGVLRNPTNAELAGMLGLSARGAPPALCDLIIVGGGPAGLAAAVYGASEGLDTQLIEKLAFGGQASTSARIENYLGFPTGISGSELAERATLQARRFGARLVVPAQARTLAYEDGHFAIELPTQRRCEAGRSSSRPGRATAGSTFPDSRTSRWAGSSSPQPRRRVSSAPATRWSSSAAAILPARRRCSSRSVRLRRRLSCGDPIWESRCRAT